MFGRTVSKHRRPARLSRPAIAALALLLSCQVVVVSKTDVTLVAPRARDLGIPFEGDPGPLNAITDVRGVEVGEVTLIEGEGRLVEGKGPVRTGVTAILPLGKNGSDTPVPAAVFSFNGNGEMTGAAWVEESGFLEGPILFTNTHSVGVVRDAVVEWGGDKVSRNRPLQPAGRRGNVGWRPQRHQRFSRQEGARVSCA